jgi:hypothetical protein
MKTLRLVASVAGLALPFSISAPARAQDAASMSCDQLWYARNQIYARHGYCFQTPHARAVFGPGCFPPFGQLGGWERDRANELQMWERRNGC